MDVIGFPYPCSGQPPVFNGRTVPVFEQKGKARCITCERERRDRTVMMNPFRLLI
jgi:hypothetical protein